MRLISIASLTFLVAGGLSGGTYLGIIAIQPPFPSASDVITVVVSGQLPSPCYPAPNAAATVSGQNLTVNLSSTALVDRVCSPVITPFSSSANIGRLPAGTYTVTVRLNLDGRFIESTFQSFEVGPTCTYSLSSNGRVFQAGGGTGSLNVITSSGCGWSVGGFPNWVSGITPTSALGSGTVAFQVAPNTGGNRSAILTVAGRPYNLDQAGPAGGLNVVGAMAQIASGGQWKTTITLINKSATPATVRLNFFDDRGNPLALPLNFPQNPAASDLPPAATIERSVNPGAALVIESSRPDATQTLVGWAQLLASGDVSGFAVLSAQQWEAAVPLENGTADSFVLYFDGTNGSATGVALANTTAQSLTLTATVRDDSGATITSNTITIPAMGHTSFNMADQYSATAQKRGTLEVRAAAAGQIIGLGLRFGPTGAFSTVPVVPR